MPASSLPAPWTDLLTFFPLPPVHREAGTSVNLCQRLAHLSLGLQDQQLHPSLHVVRPPPQLAQVGHRQGHEAAAAADQFVFLLRLPQRGAPWPRALGYHLRSLYVPEGGGGGGGGHPRQRRGQPGPQPGAASRPRAVPQPAALLGASRARGPADASGRAATGPSAQLPAANPRRAPAGTRAQPAQVQGHVPALSLLGSARVPVTGP